MGSELQKHTSKLAVASMVIGILNFIPIILARYFELKLLIFPLFPILGIFVAILAFILSIIATFQIIDKPNLKGMVFAILGVLFSFSYILLGFLILIIF